MITATMHSNMHMPASAKSCYGFCRLGIRTMQFSVVGLTLLLGPTFFLGAPLWPINLWIGFHSADGPENLQCTCPLQVFPGSSFLWVFVVCRQGLAYCETRWCGPWNASFHRGCRWRATPSYNTCGSCTYVFKYVVTGNNLDRFRFLTTLSKGAEQLVIFARLCAVLIRYLSEVLFPTAGDCLQIYRKPHQTHQPLCWPTPVRLAGGENFWFCDSRLETGVPTVKVGSQGMKTTSDINFAISFTSSTSHLHQDTFSHLR